MPRSFDRRRILTPPPAPNRRLQRPPRTMSNRDDFDAVGLDTIHDPVRPDGHVSQRFTKISRFGRLAKPLWHLSEGINLVAQFPHKSLCVERIPAGNYRFDLVEIRSREWRDDN